MFCPRCATQNDLDQNYCRQCGQPLSGVRLSLDGSLVPSLDTIRKGERLVRIGTLTLVIFNIITLIVAITTVISIGLVTPSILSIIFDLVLGLGIGLPLILAGKSKLKNVPLLMPQRADVGHSLPEATKRNDLLTSDLSPEPQRLPSPVSVTEQTTFDLQKANKVGRGQS